MKRLLLRMPRFLGEKLIIVIIFFLFTLFFSNDFGLIDIQKTAIILAAGVDKNEEGTFSVTAQIAVPQASKSGGENKAVSVTGEGETIAQAFKEINAKTGWFPKLIFCDLILLGEDTAKENLFDCLGYFLSNEYMSDNCLLATCEGKAEEVLNAKVPTENMTSFALQKILASEAKQAGNISTINLKDFAVGYFAEHKSGFMPYIRMISQSEGAGSGGDSGGQSSFSILPVQGSGGSGGSGGKSGGGSQDSKSQEKMFDATATAIFYEGKQVGLLEKNQSFAMNLALNNIRQATLQVPLKDKVYAIDLTDVSSDIHFEINNNNPLLKVSLKATAQTSDASTPRPLEEIATPTQVKKEVLKKAEENLKNSLVSVFETCRAVKCDIFEVLDKLQKYEPDYHKAFKDILLQRIIPSFEVKITSAS
ncbi:MAG: hypothetical protein J6R24_00950 [Clostridia bacterium]|nr:hypothetical protein [Clostridia bacterium]